MREKIACGWLMALIMAPSLAHAQGVSLRTTSGGDLGVQVLGYSYDAERNGTSELALASKKIGIVGSFTSAHPDGWFWGGEGRYASGGTTFYSATRGSNSGNPESLIELRLLAGKDIITGAHVWAPHIGLGYRSIYSNLKGYTDAGYVSPTRTANQVYLPIGVTHRMAAGPDARWSTTAEADYLLTGTQQTRYTDIVGYVSDLNVTQRRGYGARLTLAYETVRWSAGIFFHYWNLDESELGTYANSTTFYSSTEARNVTREAGIQLRFRFE